MRYSSDKQSAEAILSDSFFKIFTKINTYSGAGSFEGWMRKIVVNTCLSFIKQNKNSKINIVQEEIDWAGADVVFDDNRALSNLGIQELSVYIQSLPKMSRAVFNLNVFEGYTHKEIADSLGISEGTSHWHLNFARQSLKSKIANHG
jgi:RNA polymerase sigma factor (sigma-70 family)